MSWFRKGDSGLSLPLFALAHAVLLLGVFRGIYALNATGIDLYYGYAGKILAGQLPYRDFIAEYPPLALVFFTIPRLIGKSYVAYYNVFQYQLLAFDLAALAALYVAARRAGLSPLRVLTAYTIAMLAIGPISVQQYDLIPAALTLLTLVAYLSGRHALAGVALGLGVLTKVYPILLAPLLVIDAWQRGAPRRIAVAAVAFVATCIAGMLPWLASAPSSLRVPAGYHTARGIQIESSWAAISLLARVLRLTWVEVNHSFGSFNITGPLTDALSHIATIALLASLIAAYAWYYRRSRTDADGGLVLVSRASLIVLLAALATTKVFSPQYLIWVAPLVPLADPDRWLANLGFFVGIGLFTVFVFPFNYDALLARDTIPVLALAIRDGLVVAFAIRLARRESPTAVRLVEFAP